MKKRDLPCIVLRLYLALALVFVFAPVISLVLMSFHEGQVPTFPIEQFSTKWYGYAWSNTEFREGSWTSLCVASAAAPLSTILGLISANVLCRHRPRREMIYVALVTLPCLVPLLLSGMALLMYYQKIHLFGSKWSIIAAHTCYCSPFALAIIRSSYQTLNIQLEQAARNLGARPSQVIFRVVLPQLWPALVSATAISFVVSWDEFILAWFVGGFTKTLPTVIYGTLGTSLNPSLNAVGALAMLVSSIVLAAALLLQQLVSRKMNLS
jgi:spermidine/putrescine transport system permease protein